MKIFLPLKPRPAHVNTIHCDGVHVTERGTGQGEKSSHSLHATAMVVPPSSVTCRITQTALVLVVASNDLLSPVLPCD